jgi:copper chaperone
MNQSFQHTFEVSGMTCGHCEKAVTRAIKQVDPAAEVVIDRTQNRVDVQSNQSRKALVKAIVEVGYQVAA